MGQQNTRKSINRNRITVTAIIIIMVIIIINKIIERTNQKITKILTKFYLTIMIFQQLVDR
jgi:hypothetical protein